METIKDKYLTPQSAVDLIYPYISKFKTIWCPFDKEDSNFVTTFKNNNKVVINSHIDNGEDFLKYTPQEDYDVIVSNPPFSILDKIIKRLYDLDKPYAIIIPVSSLQGNTKFKYIQDTAQVLIPENRIAYLDPRSKNMLPSVSFASCFLCKDVLPERLIYRKYYNYK